MHRQGFAELNQRGNIAAQVLVQSACGEGDAAFNYEFVSRLPDVLQFRENKAIVLVFLAFVFSKDGHNLIRQL